MCNPAAIGIIGGVAGLAGGVIQGVGAAETRETNAVNYELRADAATRDIRTERASSAYAIAAKRMEIKKTLGNARAGYAANGLALSGSAADVINESAVEGDLDVAAIRWNSKNKIAGLKFERSTYLYNAGQERAGKGLALASGVLGGVARFGGSFG